MDGENVNIKIEGKEGKIILLTGPAEPHNTPVKYSASGTIDTPHNYFDKIGKHYPDVAQKAVVVIDKRNGKIHLKVNPEDQLAAEIKGEVMRHPDLAGLKINQEATFTADEIVAYLRQNPHILAPKEKETARSLANKFKNLQYTIKQTIENENDEKGTVLEKFVQKIDSKTIPDTLTVRGPLYIGGEDHTFELTLGIEARPRAVVFYFFCETFELERRKELEALVGAELKKFQDAGVCVIESN